MKKINMEGINEKQQYIENNIKELIGKFIKSRSVDEHCEYHSFDHCHKYFSEHYKDKDVDYDEMALNLFAFLASWGMLRGSTFMFHKDYKFLKPICEILCKSEYYDLFEFNPCSLEEKDYDRYITIIMGLKNEIVKRFAREFRSPERMTGEMGDQIKEKEVSDTLVGKILLSTYACIPAYDRYIEKALKKCKRGVAFINKNGLAFLFDLTKKCEKAILKFEEEYNRPKKEEESVLHYPIMKHMDELLWCAGMEFEEEENEAKKKKEEQK